MTADAIDVRRVDERDAAALADVDAASFGEPWTADAVRALLEGGLTIAFLASRQGQPTGAALVRVVAGEGELLRIAVRPEARRQGVGRVLLEAVLSAIADQCPDGVHLEVRASNVAARRLYADAGFVEQGQRRDYYQAPREHAVLMRWPPPAGGAARATGA